MVGMQEALGLILDTIETGMVVHDCNASTWVRGRSSGSLKLHSLGYRPWRKWGGEEEGTRKKKLYNFSPPELQGQVPQNKASPPEALFPHTSDDILMCLNEF